MTEQNKFINDQILATFFLITYNQEKYISDALEGAFSQTYSPLEIVISDDCSTDGTFKIIEEKCARYTGPHKIVINRNPENLGLIGHINRITSLSGGELIVYAAGDDIALPERTEKLVERYLSSGRKASLLHSSVILIDNAGNKLKTRNPPTVSLSSNLAAMALSGALIIGATSAFTRKLEETYGPIKYDKCIEDLVMGFRSAMLGGLEYIDEPLIEYRHEAGITAIPDTRNFSFSDFVKRETRNIEIFLDILAQRAEDISKSGFEYLLPLIKSKRSEVLLKLNVWHQRDNLKRIVFYAYRTQQLKEFFYLLIRKGKKRFFFPLKKLVIG
ncbi:MAG: glycosyltransferase [Chlorobiaceae bacterium]|nr:glycosyltransferase [Chlorobiaceae bacterium]